MTSALLFFLEIALAVWGFMWLYTNGSSVGKESACNARDPSLIPGSGRSAGEGKGYPLQYSGLESSVHGVVNSRMLLRDFHFQSVWTFSPPNLKKIFGHATLHVES